MASSKAKMAVGNNSKRPYSLLLLLLLAIGTAMTCAVVLHKLRDSRLLGLLLQERERKLLEYQGLLQRERETSQDMKRKLYDKEAKEDALKNQQLVLTDKLSETEKTVARLKEMKTELEEALEEKRTQIDKLTDKAEQLGSTNLQVANLTALLKQKEAEVVEMQRIITKESQVENNTTVCSIAGMYSSPLDSGVDPEELLKADNVSSKDQEEAQVSVDDGRSNHTSGAEILASKEVEKTQDVEFDAKHTERTEAQMKESDLNNIYSMNASAAGSLAISQLEGPQLEGFSNDEEKVENSEDELTQEKKWVKFETIMDESTSKSKNLSSLNLYESNESEGQYSSNQPQGNETLGFVEDKETVDIYFDTKHGEDTNIKMKENDSNNDKADHAYVTKIEEQQKTPQVSDEAVKSESKEKVKRYRRRNRVRRKTVKSTEPKRTEEEQSGKTQSNQVVRENIDTKEQYDKERNSEMEEPI
ncbi:hypothetical protein HPP92_009404 [Vanilla planifolia]|uniref:Micronuclear linker histone polyprotein-like protein n=1 Tax=Vanilla planifolia TaxID=51239 RepID=A0A835RCB3_VANPL|nr:hypothetical protein HPP92_009404 [Vanilla planifolia]